MIDNASEKHRSAHSTSGPNKSSVVAVVIGRNEGERLVRCFASVRRQVDHVIYVDSGSSDNSVANARAAGAKVVRLDLSQPFTAARARNEGLKTARVIANAIYVQFIDGDCDLQDGWIDKAQLFLHQNSQVAVVSGHLRERFPEASIYNRLCDREWNTPTGRTRACGGIAMMRMAALDQVGGFNSSLIAGEEPELCIRLRANGWEIWRLDNDMALHDAAMTRFGQWWNRARRSGYAAAEGMALHGRAPEWHGVATVRRALLWGFVLPLLGIASTAFVSPWALALLLAYPIQVVRLASRGGKQGDWEEAFFLVLGKFAEVTGVLEFQLRTFRRQPAEVIE
jgi:glycosyltransferase involved in cell wall biosynthesis